MSLDIRKESWLLIGFSTLCTFGVAVVFPYIPIHGEDIGIPISIIGQMVVIFYLLQAITRVPLGKITDLFGHHQPVLFGSILYLLSAVSFLTSFLFWPLLFIGEIFLGIANSVVWVTIPSYISGIKDAIPLYSFSLGFGWLVGSPAGGYIKDSFGMGAVFLTLLAVSAVLVIQACIFTRLRRNLSDSRKSLFRYFRKLAVDSPGIEFIYPSLRSYSEAWKQLKTNKDLLIASLFSFLIFMTFGLGASLVPIYLSSIGITSFSIGILISVRMSTVTLIRMVSERIIGRFGPNTTLVSSTLIAAISLIIIAASESLVLITLFSMLWGLGLGLYLPVILDIIGETVNKEERGVAMGARGTLGTLGAAVGNLIFSAIAGFLSVSISLVIAGLVAVIGSIFLGVIKYHFDQQTLE